MNTATCSLPHPATSSVGDRPRIAITVGDPAGIGPEVCLKLLGQPAVLAICQPIFFGDWAV